MDDGGVPEDKQPKQYDIEGGGSDSDASKGSLSSEGRARRKTVKKKGMSAVALGKQRATSETTEVPKKRKRAKKKKDDEVEEEEAVADMDPVLVEQEDAYIGELRNFIVEHREKLDEDIPPPSRGPLHKDGVKRLKRLEEILEDLFGIYARMYKKPPDYFPRLMGYGVAHKGKNHWNDYLKGFAAEPETAMRPGGTYLVDHQD